VATTGSSSVIAILIGGVRRENPIWTAKLSDLLAGRPLWRQVCSVADQVVGSALINDTLYLQTTKDAENGKIVMTSASRPSLASAKTIVPESDVVIQEITVAKDALYVMDMDGGYSRLRRRAHGEGVPVSTLAMPFEGAGSFLGSDVHKDGVLLRFASWLESPKIYEVKGASATITDTGLQPTSPINTVAYEAIRTFVTARDNTKVPLSIIRKKGAPKDGTSPTLVQAYGAYQISSPPGFWARGFAFLEAGGTLVTAHVRGGGEYGRRWWKAGKQLTKPNTWRDVIDCCDYLVKEGYTSAGKLAMSGTSAGGIAAGRVLTERPDLFCAVIPRVGVLNALRMEFTQNGPPNIAEFGTVKEADGFKGLREMDSLFHVRDGTRYPAVLLTHGMTDPRVEPWNSAKMVARLRAADPVGGPFLLRVTFDAGHGLGSTRTQVDTEWTDIFSFILSRAKASA
jgi:prolyl oligopeptidase